MADLKVLSGNGPRAAVRELCEQFARATGTAVDVQLDVNPEVVRRGQAGEAFDVAVGNPSTIEQLITSGHVVAGSLTDFGASGLAVGIRAGAAKPAIGTVEDFKRTLLAAKAVAFPAHGASGLYFAGLVDRLGLAREMQGKLKPMPAEDCVEVVARGEADMVVVVATRMVGVAGIEVAGPLPQPLQTRIEFAAGLSAATRQPDSRAGADRVPQRAVGRRHTQAERCRAGALSAVFGTRPKSLLHPGHRKRHHGPGLSMIRIFLDRLYLFAGYAAGVFLVLIFGIMMFGSLGRQVGLNIPAGDDFASWCMCAMAFLGLAHTFKRGEIIRVGILIEQFTGRKRWAVEVLALSVATAFTLYFTWYAVAMTYDSWRFNDMAQGVLSIPLWMPQLGYSGGLLILAVALVDELIHVLKGNKPTYEKEPPSSPDELVERIASGGGG